MTSSLETARQQQQHKFQHKLPIGAGRGGSCPPGDILAPPQTFILGHYFLGTLAKKVFLGKKRRSKSGEDFFFRER